MLNPNPIYGLPPIARDENDRDGREEGNNRGQGIIGDTGNNRGQTTLFLAAQKANTQMNINRGLSPIV